MSEPAPGLQQQYGPWIANGAEEAAIQLRAHVPLETHLLQGTITFQLILTLASSMCSEPLWTSTVLLDMKHISSRKKLLGIQDKGPSAPQRAAGKEIGLANFGP